MRLLYIFLLASLAICQTGVMRVQRRAVAGHPNGYEYLRTLTVSSNQITGTLTNFPAAVAGTWNELRTVANGGHVQSTCSGGNVTAPCDMIFTSDANGSTLLSWEVESYDATTGALVAWVKVPSAATNTVVYWWYGKSGINSFLGNVTGTWDAYYNGVWHLAEESGTRYNSEDSARYGTPTGSPGNATGKIGFGLPLNSGLGEYLTLSACPAVAYGNAFQVEAWNNGSGPIYEERYSPNSSYLRLFQSGAEAYDATNTVTLTGGLPTWHHIVVRKQSSDSWQLIVDGAVVDTDATEVLGFSCTTAYIGRDQNSRFNGTLDEVRVSTYDRSDAWNLATFRNGNAPLTFWTVGAEQ